MAVAISQGPFNFLPHINTLVKSGVRSVQKDLPCLPGTFWSLKHKHFDLDNDEVLLFEVLPDSVEVSVVKKNETTDLNPCQAIYVDDKWKIIGYTAAKCNLTIPEYEGSGMITAVFKDGRWMEYTNLAERRQTFKRWYGSLEEDQAVVVTGIAEKSMLKCIVCPVLDDEHPPFNNA